MSRLVGFFSCFVVVFFGIVSAQEGGSTQRVQNLCDEGNKAYSDEDYKTAIEIYLEATTYPEAEDRKSTIFYNVSCSYSLLGEAAKSLAYLDSAIEAGYTDYTWISYDSDFDLLRQDHQKEFKQIIARARSSNADEISKKTPIDVIVYDNYDGSTPEYSWGDINQPEMDTLRSRYQLRQIVESGRTDFDKMKLLLDWVSNKWQHDGTKMAPERTALAILTEVDKGKRFCCANYADVFVGCMNALGYPTRSVALRRADIAYSQGAGHNCVEVWSNQYQKWIVVDAQNNAWWESNGQPLSAYECHQLLINGKEEKLEFMGPKGWLDNRHKAFWSAYFYHVVCADAKEGGLTLVSDTVLPELIFKGRFDNSKFTDEYDKVYPRLNQTKISFEHDRNRSLDSLDVILTHTMPFFDKLLVRIDETEWKETNNKFLWALHEGLNTIEAKAVNATGIEGRTSKIVLRNNLGNSD